jgi:hypothetical protein
VITSTTVDYTSYIKTIVDSAPTLTDEQVQRLAGIVQGASLRTKQGGQR